MKDFYKIKSMGRMLLKLEMKSSDGSFKKLILLYISFLIPGIFIPLLIKLQNPLLPEYSFITFLLFSTLVAFTVINDLDNLIISKTEAEIVSSIPVSNYVIAHAKAYMLRRYIAYLSLPLLIPGAVIHYLISHSLFFSFSYLISGYLLFLYITVIISIVYTFIIIRFNPTYTGRARLVFQLLIVLFLILGYQFISYSITGDLKTSGVVIWLKTGGFIDFFPQTWFAFLTYDNNYIINIPLLAKIILPFVIVILGHMSLTGYLEVNFPILREKFLLSQSADKSGYIGRKNIIGRLVSDLIHKIYIRNNPERAFFGLMTSVYKHDKQIKSTMLPMIIIPAGLALFGFITDQLPDPIDGGYLESRPVFHISILLCVIVVLNTVILGTRTTNHPEASWIYRTLPLNNGSFINGIRKFYVIYFIVPCCLLVSVLLIFKIRCDHVMIHSLFIFASANIYNSLFFLFSKQLPFTEENSLINSIHRMAALFYPFAYGILITILQIIVYKNLSTLVTAIIFIFMITYVLNRSIVRKYPHNSLRTS
jgi:hypothetical protein